MAWISLGAQHNFAPGTKTPVSIGGDSLLVLVSQTGRFYIIENQCSHADVKLNSAQWDPQKSLLTCVAHGAVFALEDQARPIVGPACVALQTYASRLVSAASGETLLQVDIPA